MKYSLFSKYGVEIEYMIVDTKTLQILPISDAVLKTTDGSVSDEINRPSGLNWSNELAAHVVEVRPTLPVDSLETLAESFAKEVSAINALLIPYNACLLPTGAHPFMDPTRETQLWGHQWHEVYEHYDELFNCHRHGWANLQSTHLNFSFQNDAEFGKLHAAIRLILPLIPALAASTPILDGKYTGMLDSRLEVYRTNQEKYPLVTGAIVPEAAWSEAEYTEKILLPLYAQIAPVDPDKVLSTPALNSRGARVNFEEGRIEIRLIDSQECPAADIALCQFITACVQLFVSGKYAATTEQQQFSHTELSTILLDCISTAETTKITNAHYLKTIGYDGTVGIAGNVLLQLLEHIVCESGEQPWMSLIRTILQTGTLSTRIKNALPQKPDHDDIVHIYAKLARCLATNTVFTE